MVRRCLTGCNQSAMWQVAWITCVPGKNRKPVARRSCACKPEREPAASVLAATQLLPLGSGCFDHTRNASDRMQVHFLHFHR